MQKKKNWYLPIYNYIQHRDRTPAPAVPQPRYRFTMADQEEDDFIVVINEELSGVIGEVESECDT